MTKKSRTKSTCIKTIIRSKAANPSKPMEELYNELRAIAGQLFRSERPDHTLQPTALINETFIRLWRYGPKKYRNRAHFFGIVSCTMRRILIEHA